MTVPSIIWILIFCYYPMYGVLIAFKRFSYKEGIWGSPWVGLENFQFLFNYNGVGRVFFNTVFLNILFLASTTLLSILLALVFVEIKHKVYNKVVQTIAIFPHFVSWTVVAMFLSGIIGSSGMVTRWITDATGTAPDFYTNPAWWPLILVLLRIWQGAGYGTIVYVAAITGFDQEMYEAASIDGASQWQKIRYLTIPSLVPTMMIMVLLAIGNIFRGDFGLFYQTVQSSALLQPYTDVIDTYVFRLLIDSSDYGVSSAAGFYQSVLCFVTIMICNGIVKKIQPDYALY